MKVIIIDDMEVDIAITSNLLKGIYGANLQLDVRNSSSEGLQVLITNDYDVALVDYDMPGENGIDLIIRALEKGCTRPLIMLTSMQDRMVDEKALRAGAMDFVNKQEINKVNLERSIRYSIRQKDTENKLQKALADRQKLLSEIDSRVNQNLSIMSNVMNVNSSSQQDKMVINALEHAKNRILSIGTVQSILYKQEGVQKIFVKDFLETLVKNTLVNYPALTEKLILDIRIPDKQELPFANSVPLGLIIGEIISNSCKYAFASQTNPKITVQTQNSADGFFTLVVADNGPGMKKDQRGMGFSLIELLASQINAQAQLESSHGTQWTISFAPELPQEARAEYLEEL
jgi:two-component sensor histidine kinase